MRALSLVAAAGIIAIAASAAAEDLSDQFQQSSRLVIDLGAFWWEAQSSGKIGFPRRVNGAGNTLDFREDLNFEPTTGAPVGKVHLFLSERWLLRLEYWESRQEAQAQLPQSIVFDTTRFAAGERVQSRVTARNADLIVGYQIPIKRNLDVSLAGGINLFDFNQQISGKSGVGDFSLTQTSPLVGVAGEYDFSSRIALWSCSMGYFGEGLNAKQSLLRTDTALLVRVFRTARLAIGYKSFWFAGKDAVDSLEYRLMGPYAGLTLAF